MSGAEQRLHFPVEAEVPESKRESDWREKLEKYLSLGVAELVRFDPESSEPLRVWDLVASELVERASTAAARSRYLRGFWVVVEHPGVGLALRLSRHEDGSDLYPTPAEAAEQRELEAELRRRPS